MKNRAKIGPIAQPVTAFGPFTFDPASGVLRGNAADTRLGQRTAALLGALIMADGQTARKSELLQAGWPGMVVEERNLTVQIAALRKALGSRPDGQNWIVTVPRAGYRLAGAVHAELPAVAELPLITVLPFANLGGDPEQEYFADGVVEDIIAALSRFKSLRVVARNSSFVYKGKTADVRRVAQELGARYVLEGSVRRAGARLRIAAQLIDAGTGANLWAEHFDGGLDSVFDFQDLITESVAAIVEPKIQQAEIERSRGGRPGSFAAYDLYLQAQADVTCSQPEANERAISLLERSIALDPRFAPALACTGMAYLMRVAFQFPGASNADAERALALARAAVACGRADAFVLALSGYTLIEMGRDYAGGLVLLRRAVNENPNDTMVLGKAGMAMLLGGDLSGAADYFQRALRLNPSGYATHWQLTGMAHVRLAEGHYAEALDWATRSHAVNPEYVANHWMLIAANAHLGRMDEAGWQLDALENISPGVTLSRVRRGQHSIDPHRTDVLIEGMRLAGMAEE